MGKKAKKEQVRPDPVPPNTGTPWQPPSQERVLDVFGVDDAGVYHPPSRARYEQWELIHAERRRLTIKLAAIVEELSQHIPSSSNDCLPQLRRDDSDRLCALFRALPITWRQHVGRLEEEETR